MLDPKFIRENPDIVKEATRVKRVATPEMVDAWLAADAFDRLYREGAARPKIMAIAIHPYISGQPFRINYLERVYAYIAQFSGVVHWNGAEIYEWYNRTAKVHT